MDPDPKYEVKLRIKHAKCPFLEFSKAIPNIPYRVVCKKNYDLLLFPGRINSEVVKHLNDYFPKITDPVILPANGDYATYVIMDCHYTDEHHVPDVIEGNYGVLISTVNFFQGVETYEFIVFQQSHLGNILKGFDEHGFEYDIEYIRSIKESTASEKLEDTSLPIYELLEQLTSNQLHILTRVHENGYYRIPREIRLKDIAEELGVSRQAIQKSLRKAENKIMDIIVPFLNFEYCLRLKEIPDWLFQREQQF